MTISKLAGAIWTAALLCGTPAAAQDWTEYRNDRYGFTFRYPSDVFAPDRGSEAGDGQAFVARDGDAQLLVGALHNETGYTPAAYQNYVARTSYRDFQLDYRRISGNWFALSGEGKGKVFYEKVMFTCGGRLINSFALIYPSEQRHVFDPIVERIENTFRPGRSCDDASLKLPPTPAPLSPAARLPRNEPRSPLADRIARERGRDVIVIMRRNGPPYDRKILRGYVSRP